MTHSDVRTYRAASIQEALQMVEQDLGFEAVILQTRQIPQKRWLPWQEVREEVEVTAGVGWNITPATFDTDGSQPAATPVAQPSTPPEPEPEPEPEP